MAIPRPSRPKAVVFDLDGTLIDSAADLAAILNGILADRDLAPFSVGEVRGFIGHGIRALLTKAFAARGRPVPDEDLDRWTALYIERYSADPVAATTLFPGVIETLSALKAAGTRVGICTNKAEGPARLILAGLGLDSFVDAVVGGDSGFGTKPRPEPLLACFEKLGVRPQDGVYVGDMTIDADTARAAATPFILVVPAAVSGGPHDAPDEALRDFAALAGKLGVA